MSLFKRFFMLCLCVFPMIAQGQVSTTAGSNLTAWNGSLGVANNNSWNQLTNNRTMAGGGGGAKADFGNCNSLILRCAQPKCGGCTSIDIAKPIVAGCVNSNAACKQYGDDLIEFISAQLVSNATNKAQQAQIAAQQAAAQAAATQNNSQIQQMQQQMQQMQYEMQQQNAQQMAQMQTALDEQKALTAAAMEQVNKSNNVASSTSSVSKLTEEDIEAAERDIEADIIARKKISGQILSGIENAEIALKSLKASINDAFVYAGCDMRGDNCSGPKRVKIFKEKALASFEKYDEIADEIYEALEKALAVGVDVSDVIMMLNGGCNQWGKFLCTGEDGEHEIEFYEDGETCKNGRSVKKGYVKGGQECTDGMAVPPQDDIRCTVTQLIGGGSENDEVLREWISEADEDDHLVRVGCATSALESIAIFGRRSSKRGATLDLDTLERIILQDAPDYIGTNRYSQGPSDTEIDRLKYCALTPTGYQNLLTAVQSKKLPKEICVSNKQLEHDAKYKGWIKFIDETGLSLDKTHTPFNKDDCKDGSDFDDWVKSEDRDCGLRWDEDDGRCKLTGGCTYDDGEIISNSESE